MNGTLVRKSQPDFDELNSFLKKMCEKFKSYACKTFSCMS